MVKMNHFIHLQFMFVTTDIGDVAGLFQDNSYCEHALYTLHVHVHVEIESIRFRIRYNNCLNAIVDSKQ